MKAGEPRGKLASARGGLLGAGHCRWVEEVFDFSLERRESGITVRHENGLDLCFGFGRLSLVTWVCCFMELVEDWRGHFERGGLMVLGIALGGAVVEMDERTWLRMEVGGGGGGLLGVWVCEAWCLQKRKFDGLGRPTEPFPDSCL